MDGFLTLFQGLVIFTFLFIGVVLVLGLFFGREYRRNRQSGLLLGVHIIYMEAALFLTVFGVILVEAFLFFFGRQRGWLLWVHLGFAVPFLISLMLLSGATPIERLNFNGLRFPVLHRRWGYICILIFYVGMLVTGIPLLFR